MDREQLAHGPKMWLVFKGKVQRVGGEAAWSRRADVGSDGFIKRWEGRAAEASRRVMWRGDGRLMIDGAEADEDAAEAVGPGECWPFNLKRH